MRTPGKAASPAFDLSGSKALIALGIFAALMSTSPSAKAAADKSLIKSQEGSSALLRGRFDLAVAAYDDALKDTNLPAASQAGLYSDRGVAKWRLKRPDEAVADFTKAVTLNPEYAPAYNNRGNVFLEMNRAEDAYKDFDRAVSLAPDFGVAYSNRANANQRLNKLEAAEKDFRKAIELMPGSAVPLNGRGKIASATGQYYTALRYLNRAIALNAQYAPAYQNRAAVYVTLKQNEEAVQDLDKVIALAPDNANLYVARGRAYARDNRWSQAFRDFSKAIELAPGNVPALTGRASQNIDRKRADLAVEDLNRAITLDPKAADAYFWRAQAKYTMGDAQAAEADLSKAIELDPSFADAYRIRGSYRERAGKRDDAIADYRRAVERDPFSKEARDAYKAASGDTADSIVKPLAPAVDGWEVFYSASGRYTALNEHYARTPILLEVQNSGPVEIVEWTPLKESLSGIGLLRYRAGEKTEYVVIIDLSRGQVVSIEPYIMGDAKSKWAWTQNAVTVTDPDGLASFYELRKPADARAPVARRDENPFSLFGGGRRGNRGGPGLFGWLFQ
jgi:tetratricopeptide (TPR) repeat protein